MANDPSNPQNQAGRGAPGTGARDGIKPAPASPSVPGSPAPDILAGLDALDRKSTRLNSCHVETSYAVFCLKKKKSDGKDACVGKMASAHLQVRDHSAQAPVHLSPSRGLGACVDAMCEQRLLDFFFNDTATTEIYTLSLHDALPI